MLKDNKGQLTNNPIIIGVMILAMLGIVLGIVVMVYAEIDPIILDAASYEAVDESTTWNFTDSIFHTVDNTMAAEPHVTISNTTNTLTEDTEYIVHIANSTIEASSSLMLNNSAYDIDYSYQGDAYSSAETVSSNVYKGFNMASISPLVMAAGLIISIVLTMLGAMYLGGRRD